MNADHRSTACRRRRPFHFLRHGGGTAGPVVPVFGSLWSPVPVSGRREASAAVGGRRQRWAEGGGRRESRREGVSKWVVAIGHRRRLKYVLFFPCFNHKNIVLRPKLDYLDGNCLNTHTKRSLPPCPSPHTRGSMFNLSRQ